MTNIQEGKRKLTISDFTKTYSFSPSSAKSLNSMKDGLHYTLLVDNSKINKYSYETGELVSTLFDIDNVDQSEITVPISSVRDYSFNADETFILIIPYKQMIYRRSFTTNYYLYEIATKKLIPISRKPNQKCATFSPDGKNIAFVRQNNLYIYNIENKTETKITTDGAINRIINGETDWVYEEEFEFTRAYEWSSDGHALAYIKFDETLVPKYVLQYYKGSYPTYTKNEMYPENYSYKYPKAGETNSTVSVHVYDLAKKTTITIEVDKNTDTYIPRIRFTKDPQTLSIFHLNRHQNCLTIFSANVDTGEIHTMYREKNKYFIDSKSFDQLQFLDNGKSFAIESEETGYNHVYSFDINYNSETDKYTDEDFQKRKTPITKGDFDVKDFIGFDETRKLYYYSSYEESSLELYVYCIDEKGNKKKITPKKGWNTIKHSKNFNYIIVENSSTDTVPNTILYRNDLSIDSNGITGELAEIKVLEDNSELKETINSIEYLPKVEFFTGLAADNKTEINMCILKPKEMISMEQNHEVPKKKFPLLITLYGGPNYQFVKNEYNIGWTSYLVQEGFIVASIDPRGSAAHGEEFRKCTYLKLGNIETQDVIFGTKGIINKYSDFIDEKSVGIWGWSYGGFMSLLCLSNGADVFSTSIAVAPVTNWKYYDTIYTERYMRTPQENPLGYENEAPLHVVDRISPNAHLLICHGLCDDNVHYQNTAEYTEKLVQRGLQFDMHVYTNRNHGIYGGNTKNQLYTKFVNFLKEHMMHHE